MMQMVKVSVIIPTFNAEKTIKETVKSVVDQSLQDIEIIIINDGSTDNSIIELRKIVNKYSNVKLINKENHGVSYTRNLGIEIAKGEYLLFLDSDDTLSKDALKLMYSFAVKHSLDVVCCGYKEENATRVIKYRETGEEKIFVNKEELVEKWDDLSIQFVHGKLIKGQIFKNNDLYFDPSMKLGEDLNFMLRLLTLNLKVGYLGKSLYYINNTNPQSLSKSFVSGLGKDLEKQYQSWNNFILNREYLEIYNRNHMAFGMYLLTMYFSNLFRSNCNFNFIKKYKMIRGYLEKHTNWIEESNLGNPQNSFEKIQSFVIKTKRVILIMLLFKIKEGIRMHKVSRN